MIRVGVDVGGTFTDVILERVHDDRAREIIVTKVPSTPRNQSDGVVNGVLQACENAGVAPGDIAIVYHGTTVATNMVIERKGAKVGMITTRGFRDVLHMARHKRPHNFSLQFDVPWQSRPIIPRRDRLCVTERIMPPTGAVEVPLNEDEVRQAAEGHLCCGSAGSYNLTQPAIADRRPSTESLEDLTTVLACPPTSHPNPGTWTSRRTKR